MAEESGRSPGSKRPILAWVMVGIFAASVPVVAVVSYTVGVWNARAGRGKMVSLLKFSRDMEAGEIVTREDIKVLEVDGLYSKHLGDVVTERDLDFVVGSMLYQSAKSNRFVEFWHLVRDDGPEQVVEEGMVAVPLELDPRSALGDILRVYDRVNILAKLSVDREPLRTYRVIEGVRVMAIGQQAARDRAGRKGIPGTERASPGSYATIVIEVPSEISLELANVLSHRAGSIGIELGRYMEEARPGDGKINPELRNLAARAAPRQEATPAGQPEP